MTRAITEQFLRQMGKSKGEIILQSFHKQFCGHFKEFLELCQVRSKLVYVAQINSFQNLPKLSHLP